MIFSVDRLIQFHCENIVLFLAFIYFSCQLVSPCFDGTKHSKSLQDLSILTNSSTSFLIHIVMPSIGLFGFFILFFLKQGLRFGVFPVAMRHSRIFSAQQKFTFKDISMGLFIFTNLYLWVEIDKNLYLNPNSAEYLDSRIFWIQPFLVLNSLLLLFPLFSKSLSIFVFQPYFQSLLSSHQYSYLVDTQHLTTRSHQNILLRLVFFVKHLILAVY
eukprot:Sdes_comp24797_c0_seq1m22540